MTITTTRLTYVQPNPVASGTHPALVNCNGGCHGSFMQPLYAFSCSRCKRQPAEPSCNHTAHAM